MATPSGSGRGPANAVTPQSQQHLPAFTSPAPRSVPSPATHRQAGKSPFTATTQAHTGSSTTLHNHPTVGSSGSAPKGLLGSSPVAPMNFESPGPLSFSLSQLGGVDGAVPMAPGISGLSALGLVPLQAGITDEEKDRRLNEIINKIRSRPGKVTKQNLMALAKRLNFDVDVEYGGRGSVLIAGRSVILTVGITDDEEGVVKSAILETALPEAAKAGSLVFLNNLSPPGGSSVSRTLDKFAANLERLARIDKPQGTINDGFNGFDAIAGIYASLRKLYDHEKSIAEHLYGMDVEKELKAADEVTCKKSGRPRMCENGSIGFDLQYWKVRRHVVRDKASTSSAEDEDIFALSIECEGLRPDQLIQPARISNDWISEQIMKSAEGGADNQAQVIDWLDPAPTLTRPIGEPHLPEQEEEKPPRVRFVARLQPPLLLPGGVANESGLLQNSSFIALPSYTSALLLHDDPLEALGTVGQVIPRDYYAQRSTVIGGNRTIKHLNVLKAANFEQAVLLQDIPFDHPKQVVQLLPTLRQFALLNTMLKTSFPKAVSDQKASAWRTQAISTSSIDMMLSTSPIPRLKLTFARHRGEEAGQTRVIASQAKDNLDAFFAEGDSDAQPPISVNIAVLPNAELRIDRSNVSMSKDGTGKETHQKRLAQVLATAEDLDLWIEFLRKV